MKTHSLYFLTQYNMKGSVITMTTNGATQLVSAMEGRTEQLDDRVERFAEFDKMCMRVESQTAPLRMNMKHYSVCSI